jgi:hypothetical protein
MEAYREFDISVGKWARIIERKSVDETPVIPEFANAHKKATRTAWACPVYLDAAKKAVVRSDRLFRFAQNPVDQCQLCSRRLR